MSNCTHGKPDAAACLDCDRSRKALDREVAYVRAAMRSSFENGFELGKIRTQRIVSEVLGTEAALAIFSRVQSEECPQ
jgi:hypothetical protein